MKPSTTTAAVFLIAFAALSWNLWSIGIASGYIDPLLHFGAQDEATYTREAIAMARDGGWMTPTFLGRWVFEKPPLLMWLAAVSMKILGIGRFAARLPVVFSGALICALVFAMVRRARSMTVGIVAAVLALSSQILFTMSRHAMTDILLACAGMCGFAILLFDPELRARRSLIGFVLSVAAAVTAKSVAGVLPLCVLGVMMLASKRRPSWLRATVAGIGAIALASPWFLYNYWTHRAWFLADMGFQLITIGTAVHQTSSENHFWFYVLRILESDLLPLLLAFTAVPALVRAVRRREHVGVLTAAYLTVYFSAIMVFRFNSEQYLCWFVPSLILIAALYSPLLNGKGAAVFVGIAGLVFALKIANPEQAWGVSMRSGTTIASAPVLSRYCNEHRAATLYLIGVDDEFYSAVLPLKKVRYAWVDPTNLVGREHPHLAYLGILLPPADFARLDEKLPVFRDRLRAWGLDSTEAVATGVAANDNAGLAQLIHDHPESDFLVGRTILQNDANHKVAFASADFTLLEATKPSGQAPSEWSCEM
jgi:4-amino-4-deoxy-L-arabinose transferase-like glycosyltransferase